MKLAMVGPVYPYRGGIAHFTTRLGQILIENGHSVQMVSFSRQYPAFLYPGKTDKDPSKEHPNLISQYLLDPLYPWTWLRASNSIRYGNPELVLIQWWTTFWGPALFILTILLKANRIPVIFIIHNVMPHEERFFDRWLAKLVISRASACILLSPLEEQRLCKLLPEMRVFLSRLPIDLLASEKLPHDQARQQLGLPELVPVLLFFGIIRPYKGLGVLVEALGKLKKDGIIPILMVVGEFWEDESKYRSQIAQLDLNAQIRLENRFIPNEEVGIYFSAADFFVAPYTGGTQSAAIKVAMDFGLPILASDMICSDLPLDSYPIIVHPAGDATALAEDIQYVLTGDVEPVPQDKISGCNDWVEWLQTLQTIHDHLCRCK